MSREVIGTIREFRTKHFHVIVQALVEDDLDLSWDDDGETRRGLANGDLVAFCACVTVYCDGAEVGTDYLGNCVYESIDAFQDHRLVGVENRRLAAEGQAGRCGSYFHDMIRQACAEAREHLRSMQSIRVRL